MVKLIKLVDGNGNKIKRKVRKDSKGLYIIKNGRRGQLVKTLKVTDLDEKRRFIVVTRKVDFYTEL